LALDARSLRSGVGPAGARSRVGDAGSTAQDLASRDGRRAAAAGARGPRAGRLLL